MRFDRRVWPDRRQRLLRHCASAERGADGGDDDPEDGAASLRTRARPRISGRGRTFANTDVESNAGECPSHRVVAVAAAFAAKHNQDNSQRRTWVGSKHEPAAQTLNADRAAAHAGGHSR